MLFAALLLGGGMAVWGGTAWAQHGGFSTDAPAGPPSLSGALTSLGVVLVLTLFNGAFAMAETALVSVRPSRVDQLVEEKRGGALAVRKLIQNPSRFIATTQAGITILGFGSAAAAVPRSRPRSFLCCNRRGSAQNSRQPSPQFWSQFLFPFLR